MTRFMSNIPDNIKELLKKHDLLTNDAAWELPQRKGTWILKHKTLEQLAAKLGISFSMYVCSDAKDNVAIMVTGELGDRKEESIGEASDENCQNKYRWAMAEKRGKDRVILKLLGLHGDVYSSEEADDFKEEPVGNGFANAVTRNEYVELLNMVLESWNPHSSFVRPLEDMKKYCKRAGDTDPELKNQLVETYKKLEEVEQELEEDAEKNN